MPKAAMLPAFLGIVGIEALLISFCLLD